MTGAISNYAQTLERARYEGGRGGAAVFGQTLDWLEAHHACWAKATTHDLDADERVNAIWKLGGESLAHCRALLDMLRDGYTGQTWPTMRAIHESNRLLGAVVDPEEERIFRRWLADQEVTQGEARAAEEREAQRIAGQMKEADLDPPAADVASVSRTIYSGMSKAAHHRRSVVEESVDREARSMTYRTDPDPARRLEFVIFAGALVQETLLKGRRRAVRAVGPAALLRRTPPADAPAF